MTEELFRDDKNLHGFNFFPRPPQLVGVALALRLTLICKENNGHTLFHQIAYAKNSFPQLWKLVRFSQPEIHPQNLFSRGGSLQEGLFRRLPVLLICAQLFCYYRKDARVATISQSSLSTVNIIGRQFAYNKRVIY